MILLLTGCATSDPASSLAGTRVVEEAKKQLEEMQAVTEQRVKSAMKLPPYPASCAKLHRSNINIQDGLHIAVEKLDIALYNANNQIRRCTEYYNSLKKARDNFSLSE